MKTRQRKKLIAHVVFSFGTGGLEKGIATIINHSSSQFEHLVICLSCSGESARLLPAEVKVIELNKPSGNSISFIFKLANRLREIKPDIVHTRNWAGVDAILAAKLAGIRNIIHGEHGWDLDDPYGLNKKRIYFRRFISLFTKRNICVSMEMKRWLNEVVKVRSKVTQIYNGVDSDMFCPSQDISLSAPLTEKDFFVIGIVARLDPIKDHSCLFSAFKKLRQSNKNSKLLVVGDGPEKNRLKTAAVEGITFLGNRSDTPSLLRSFDVFVLPSINEGISNTILEAMASGVPVIASNVGGNGELVLDGITGQLFSAGDIDELTKALKVYAQNSELRQQHGKAGRQRIVDDFTIKQMVTKYEEVYTRVISQ
jgi:sugar transferase (PEP-CTERM/EpsH1 system associated)